MRRTLGAVLALATLMPFTSSAAEPTSRRVLGEDKGRVAIVDERGRQGWDYRTGAQSHDLWQLDNGNKLLAIGPATIAEVTPDRTVVWQYEATPRVGYRGRVEVHSFQPLANGLVMVAESGNRRIVEVDRDGTIQHSIDLTVDQPDAHRDTRLARKLENGNYLVCHEADGTVREYDSNGRLCGVIPSTWGDALRLRDMDPEGHGTSLYSAYRLKNGNTLIGGGNNNRVLEVNSDGKIVWTVDQKELPNITLAWVTMLHVQPNGNVIIGNCHAGPDNPQLIEVNRNKDVVWTFKDFETFGNGLAATVILDPALESQ